MSETVDLKDAPVGDLLFILKQQPIKYYAAVISFVIVVLSAVSGLSWKIATLKAEVESSKSVVELTSRASMGEAEAASLKEIVSHLEKQLSLEAAELSATQSVVDAQRRELSEKDRHLIAAQGCESIRQDARKMFAKAEKMARDLPTLEGMAKAQLESEFDVIEGKATIYNEMLKGCASRT